MGPLELAAAIIVFTLLGVLAGTGTGLAPGLHVNNVALVLLASRVAFEGTIVSLFPTATVQEIIGVESSFIMGTVISHGFLDFIPSVFLGAPEEKTALSVLPGHRLLLAGQGHSAVRLASIGALAGVALALPFLIPLRFLLGPPLDGHDRIRGGIALILLVLVAVLILSERDRRRASRFDSGVVEVVSPRSRQRLLALGFFLASGALGYAVLDTEWLTGWNWFPLAGHPTDFGSLVLFPLFTGLFGFSTLALSARSVGRVPLQRVGIDPRRLTRRRAARGLLSGTVAGACVSWLPGLSSGAATALAQFLLRRHDEDSDEADREFMVALGAVSTATSVFTVCVLFIIDRARSGAAVVIRELTGGHVPAWGNVMEPPWLLVVLAVSAGVAALASYPLAVGIGRLAARRIHRVRYDVLARVILGVLAVLLLTLSGAAGLMLAILAGVLGLGPPLAGVKRVHLMGALVVPVILLYLGLT